MKAQSCAVREARGLVEQVEVVESELLLNCLLNFDDGLIFFPVRVIVRQFDVASSGLSLNFQMDRLGASLYCHRLWETLKLTSNLWELLRVDGDQRAILSLWDGQVLNIKGDQVQSELSFSLGLWVDEFNLQGGWVLVSLKGDWIRWVSQLHHFGEVCNVDTEDNILVTSVWLESLAREIEANQCNMRCVHCLQRNT